MKVVLGLDDFSADLPTVLTIGSFDGFHRGHQRIVRMMKTVRLGEVTILTFEPHPQSVVRPEITPPALLTSREERIPLFEKAGVDNLVIAKFDLDFARMMPEEYVRRILVEKLKAKAIFVGNNHRFGARRAGDATLLQKLGIELGFNAHIVAPVKVDDEVISSSRIRNYLAGGETKVSMKMLGRPFSISGLTVHGEGRGRKLGFPTANLEEIDSNKLIPSPGIYSSTTIVDHHQWPSVTHIGPRPTFYGASSTIESHLLGFDGNLYGKRLTVNLLEKLRSIEAYDSVGELVNQMKIDCVRSRESIRALGFSETSRLKLFRFGKIN